MKILIDKDEVLLMLDKQTFIDQQPRAIRRAARIVNNAQEVEAISFRAWKQLRDSIKELHDNNGDKQDVVDVTRFILNLMDTIERKE